MIISPPFLPTRPDNADDASYVAAAMPPATVNCPASSVPEGSFPVSLNLGWHGGVHLHAPAQASAALPVCAIADGEIVYARRPTRPVAEPTHALNYNPYGDTPSWTDDGMLIVRHRTEIGAGANAEDIEFYSVFAHLSELRGNALTVAGGGATTAQRRIFRKDEIGLAGRIYNAADHIHMEIVCDDANLNKLVGRRTGTLPLTADGRGDAVYGEVYFHVPAGAALYGGEEPESNIIAPATAAIETTATDLIIGIRYASGDGAADQRGSAWLTTYQPDGTIVGVPMLDRNADYDLYDRALAVNEVYAKAHETVRPAPSAVYEIFRFGRLLNGSPETLAPSNCPHWRRVQGIQQAGWINLAAAGIRKFSDADFPDWKGWRLIDDDTDDDSRAESALLRSLIEDASSADGQLTREELIARMNIQVVRDALAKCVCKFPSEWNRDSIDARWGWLQSDPEYGLDDECWNNLRSHISALTVPVAELPGPLVAAHWHFHPQQFIFHFRKCQWLSAREFKQMVPCHAMRRVGPSSMLWEQVQPNLTGATSIAVTQRVGLNRTARKYGINSPMRLASFYGNVIQESQWLSRLSEGGGSEYWYAPWYGRGFLQLTHSSNYLDYWSFRGRRVPAALDVALRAALKVQADLQVALRSNVTLADANFPQLTSQILGWREEVRGVSMAGSTDSAYAPSDTAGFYWAKLQMAMYADVDHELERRVIIAGGATRVYYRSPSFWKASAAVNLPRRIDDLYASSLNGFDARCVAYACSLAVLSEMKFPNGAGGGSFAFPEGYEFRRA
ncbi:hypothetical protein ASE26_11045 [Duganella sp. Root198D2]|nr:hypothetical protein ASE26_11045 [Duganella sp. Root198D2]